jgi:hypothetical protein
LGTVQVVPALATLEAPKAAIRTANAQKDFAIPVRVNKNETPGVKV